MCKEEKQALKEEIALLKAEIDDCKQLKFMFQALSAMIFRVYHRLLYILSSGRAIKGEDCHEDFAVLGQLCAKIITFRLKS